jgi:hypothetical protein
MKREVSGLSSLPPSSDAKPLLDGVRLLEDSTTNNMAERAFSFEDMSTGLSLMLMNGVLCAY